MSGSEFNMWIMLTAVLAAIACALPGNFLVLRRMSMMGDAISHAVLPGIAVAFLLSESRDSMTMFVGAAIVGMLTAVLTQFVHSWGKVDASAAMGVVFTTLFAIGLILIVGGAKEVDLDPGCVLFGAIEWTPLDSVPVMGAMIPRAALVLGVFVVINLTFIIVMYKELKITSFDPALATTQGINANLVHYMLMAIVAGTTVAAFESVGSIVVVAMLIVPAATAHLLTDRLSWMLVISVIVAAASAVLGRIASATVPGWFGYTDTNIAGSIAVAGGVLFGLTALLAPRYGLISKAVRRLSLTVGIFGEDALGLLYRLEEHGVSHPRKRFVEELRAALHAPSILVRLAMGRLRRQRLVSATAIGFVLTEEGRERARGLVRSHRLWEAYLVKHVSLAPDHVHDTAMKLEHITGEDMQRDLAAGAGDPDTDPHGRSIPRT